MMQDYIHSAVDALDEPLFAKLQEGHPELTLQRVKLVLCVSLSGGMCCWGGGVGGGGGGGWGEGRSYSRPAGGLRDRQGECVLQRKKSGKRQKVCACEGGRVRV